MKLRGGLWVPDSSDAEVLAAHASRLASTPLDISAHLNDNMVGGLLVAKMHESSAASSAADSGTLDLAACFITRFISNG